MNSTPVIQHHLSDVSVFGKMPVLTRSTRPIVSMDEAALNNLALLPPDSHGQLTPVDIETIEALLAPPESPFLTVLEWLDAWVTDHDDCPGLPTLLDRLDTDGIGRSFDLKFWLDRWQRA